MKKIATLLSVLSLFLLTAISAQAQSCPVPEDPALNKQEGIYSLTVNNKTHQQILTILESDLTKEQKVTCIATKGRRAVADRINIVDPVTSILTEDWVDNAWVNEGFVEFVNNPNGFPSSFISQIWDMGTSSWVNESHGSLTYDENGFITETIGQDWNGTDFENAFRFTTSWDFSGNLLNSSFQSWYNNDWFTDGTSVSTVENGLVIMTLNQTQNEDSTGLVNLSQSTYEYDGEDRQISELLESWDVDMGVFNPVQRTLTEYSDMQNVRTSQFTADGMMWLDFNRTTNIFNEDGLEIESLFAQADFLNPGMFNDFSRSTYAYNDNDFPTESIYQMSDGMGGWINQDGTFSTYDEMTGNLLEDLHQMWDPGTGKNGAANWINDGRDTYGYDEVSTAIEDESPGRLATFSIYPSPARSRVQLDVVLEAPAALNVEVFDLLGRRVATLADNFAAAGSQRIAWEADQLPAGLYLVRFKVDSEVETRSVVLMK